MGTLCEKLLCVRQQCGALGRVCERKGSLKSGDKRERAYVVCVYGKFRQLYRSSFDESWAHCV